MNRFARDRVLTAVAFLALSSSCVYSAELPRLDDAQDDFSKGHYTEALEALKSIPGFIMVIPAISTFESEIQARIWIDAARCLLGMGERDRAWLAVRRAIHMSPQTTQGHFEGPGIEDFIATVRADIRAAHVSETTRKGAIARSVVIPGWGQWHRGKKKRALFVAAVTTAAVALWFKEYRSYKSARTDYDNIPATGITTRQGGQTEFAAQYSEVESAASTSNRMLAISVGVWMAGVLDAGFVGPAQIRLQASF